MVKASHLTKTFTSVVAVDDVSLEVNAGRILGLLGPNGAGKTTLIRMVVNILRPDCGEITYRGLPFSDAVRRETGYLPEERGIYHKSKLLDTILYFAELRGMGRDAARQEALRWLDRFDLRDQTDRRIEELSKGNQQKVQFIIAVVHGPTLVILDEPFSGLDPVNQIAVKDIMLELRKQGRAVVFSTHQMDQAERLCDEIVLINRGKTVLEGSVAEIKKRYGESVVEIEFSGDGSFVRSMPGVGNVLLYHNTAEIRLENGTSPATLLSALVPQLDIRRFEVKEPSLHSIFLQVVGENSA